METSAKENLNINDLFTALAQQMKARLKEGDKEENKDVLRLNSESGKQSEEKKKCC
jgi:hypothetical protein